MLKSTAASIILIFSLTVCGQGQFIDNYLLTVSINESLAYSTDRVTVREPEKGWEVGIIGEKQILNHLDISAGAKFSRIRFGMEDVGASQVTYFSVPIDIKVIFPWEIYAKAGPKLAFKVASRNAQKEIVINGSPAYMRDGFASVSDFFVPGWTIGVGKEFSFNGYKPWIEVTYGEDFTSFSGYDGMISMNKRVRKISLGFPLFF